MALSASSVLHYWSSRYDSIPVVGGKPVHARNSAGTWTDQRGVVQNAIVNTPRFAWADLGDGAGRRKIMRLEQSRTNVVVPSEDFTSWTNGGANVTPAAVIGPDGSLSGSKLTKTVGASDARLVGITFAGNGEKCASVFLRAGTAGVTSVNLYDNTASISRHIINVVWGADGVPTLANNAGAGNLYPVEALGGGWYRVSFSATGMVAANDNRIYIYPSNDAVVGGYVYAFGAQAENAVTPSSYVKTVAAGATRTADSFYWDCLLNPQGMISYWRFVERGSLSGGNTARVFQLGDAADSAPRLLIYSIGTGYRFLYDTGATARNSDLAVAPTFGDTVELCAILYPTGDVRLLQSINGGAVVDGGNHAALAFPASWSGARLWLNSAFTGADFGLNDFAEAKMVRYADVVGTLSADIMAELRAFELSANGVVL